MGVTGTGGFGTFQSNFQVLPNGGYFIAKNLAAGVVLGYGHSYYDYAGFLNSVYGTTATTSLNFHTLISNTYSATPFLRYYIPSKRIKPFVEAGYWLSKGFSKADADETQANFNSFVAGAGIAFFISRKVSLDLSYNYSFGDVGDRRVRLGVQFFLPSKK